jgi:protein-S-isoprenylcysteine O-methyltransferase Ste14
VEQLFKIAYFAGMVVEVILRAPYDRQRRKIEKTDQRVTAAEQAVLTVLSIGGLLLPLIYALTSWLSFADYPWSAAVNTGLGVVGLVFLAAAIWLFWRTHHDLGAGWSPSLEIGEKQQLITQGVYGAVRHPMYASQLLMGVAQALLLHNWIAGLGGLVGFLLLYLVRVPKEERMMLDHFGDKYRAYSARTGRIVPRLRREGRP